jgi:hypothetical protein
VRTPKAATGATTKPPTPQDEFTSRFNARLQMYGEHFNIEDLNDANDRTLLHIMIRTELMIEGFQAQVEQLMAEDLVNNATNIKKLADLLRDSTTSITNLQKTLGIDRKSRRSENVDSVADYIKALKANAQDFVEKRLIKVYCPDCKVMVARIAPVHKHTAFTFSSQCSQCGKAVRARRDDRDVLFDVRDSGWRKEHRAQIVQPKKLANGGAAMDQETTAMDDNLIIVADLDTGVVETAPFVLPTISEGLFIGEGGEDGTPRAT